MGPIHLVWPPCILCVRSVTLHTFCIDPCFLYENPAPCILYVNRRAAREAFFGRRPKKAELSSLECGLDTVGVSTALGWTQAARCGLACVLYARQYVRYGKNSQTQAQTTEFSDERKHIHTQYLSVRILKTFLGG